METLALAGCGADEQTATPEPAGQSETSAAAFPATVEHKLGTTIVPAEPVRVVSAGFKEQDWLYEFGVSPIAVRPWYGLVRERNQPLGRGPGRG